MWAIKTPNTIYSTPLQVADRLFVAGSDKNLHVIDLNRTTHEMIALGSKSVSTPVKIGESVFVGSNGGVIFEVDLTGQFIVGRHQLPDPMTNRVAYCADAELFFGLTYMNDLYAFRRAVG